MEIYKTIDLLVADNKKKRDAHDFFGLLMNGQTLLNAVNALIKISVENEGKYRKYEASLFGTLVDGKRPSSAYCETMAKASDYYTEWQRARQTIELMLELSNMSKKLAGGLDKELTSSH